MRNLLLLCIIFTAVASLTSARVVTFGISVNEEGGQGQVNSELLKGLIYAIERVNQFPEANRKLSSTNETFTFQLHYLRHDSNLSTFLDNYEKLAQNTSIDFVLSPPPSPAYWAFMALNISRDSGRSLFFGPADSRDNWYAAGGLGAAISSRHLMSTVIPYLVLEGVKNVSVLTVIEAFQREACEGFVRRLGYNRIDVLTFVRVTHSTTITPELLPNLTQAVNELIDAGGQVVAICAHKAILEYVINEYKSRNISPGAFVTTTFFQPFDDPKLQEFILSFSNLPPEHSAYPDIPLWGGIKDLYRTYRQRFNEEPGPMTVNALLTMDIFYRAITAAGEVDESKIYQLMKQTNFDSIVGPVIFGADGQNLLDSVLLQQTSNETIVVGPPLATTGKMVYPFPRWDMREPKYEWGSSADKLGTALIVIVMVVLIGVVVGLVLIWQTKTARASSRLFLLLSAIGSMLVELSLIPWMPGLTSDAACVARVLLLPLGASLMYSSLVVKGWRVARLFEADTLEVFRITDKKLAGILTCVVASSVILPLLMVSVGNVHAQVNVPHPYELAQNYKSCTANSAFFGLLVATLVYGGIIILAGIFIIGKIRNNIPPTLVDTYDESTPLFFATWATLLVYIILIVVHFVQDETRSEAERDRLYILTSVFLSAGLLFINIFVFGRKFELIHRGAETQSSLSSKTSSARKITL